jgi:ABC-type multidrug transport system fused ATPase/permease subunit
MKKFLLLLKKKEKFSIIIVFLFSFIVMGLETISVGIVPIIFTKFIDTGNFNALESIPISFRNLLSALETKQNLIIFVIFLFIFKSLVNYFHFVLEYLVMKRIRIRFAKEWINGILNQDYLTLQKTSISHKIWLSTLIDTATATLSNYLNLSKGIIICTSIFFIIIFFSPSNLILFYLIILFCLILFYLLFSKKLSKFGRLASLATKEKLDVLQSIFTGIKNIFIYKEELFFQKEFIERNIRGEKNQQASSFIGNIPSYFLELIGILVICVYFLIILKKEVHNSELIFHIGLVSYGSLRILSFYKVVSHNLSLIKSRKFDLVTFVDEFNNIKKKSTSNFYSHCNYNAALKTDSVIRIKNLNFSYDGSVLINISNYEFKKNKFYIVIGESGSGKSTFLDLMLNIIKPYSGEIDFAINQNSIGYVSQECFVLNDSIKKNISFAEAEEKINEQNLAESIKKASLSDFIEKFPEKENFIIMNNGSNLSIGQKQRIGIARALYRKPEIIFLDEPTSSLDELNELAILKTIEEIKKDSTVIMVTHKYKNIKNFDKLLEFKNVDLVEKI